MQRYPFIQYLIYLLYTMHTRRFEVRNPVLIQVAQVDQNDNEQYAFSKTDNELVKNMYNEPDQV